MGIEAESTIADGQIEVLLVYVNMKEREQIYNSRELCCAYCHEKGT